MLEKPSNKIIKQIHDYILENGTISPLKIERELHIDIKLVRIALSILASRGNIQQKVYVMPQPPRFLPKSTLGISQPTRFIPKGKPKSTYTKPLGTTYPKPSNFTSSTSLGISVEIPSSPPRTMHTRVPKEINEIAEKAIRSAQNKQKMARQKQKEEQNKQSYIVKNLPNI